MSSVCDQCRIDGGIKFGRKGRRIPGPPKYRVELAGSKSNLCTGHTKLLEKLCKKRGLKFQFEEIKNEANAVYGN